MWSDESDFKVQRSACVRIFLKTEKKLIQFLVALKPTNKQTNKQKKPKNKIGNACAFFIKVHSLKTMEIVCSRKRG